DAADALHHLLEVVFVDEIGLVQQHGVGERDLHTGHLGFLHLAEDLFGVDHRDDAVELHELLQRGNIDEGLRDGAGIGDAGGLDEEVIKASALEQLLYAEDEVLAYGAADAAVGEFHHLVLLFFDEGAVDADFAHLVHDDGELELALFAQDVIQQRG